MLDDQCLFCKIIRNEIPSDKVFEDEHTLVFKDIDPKAPVHMLVVPKAHYDSVQNVPAEESAIFSRIFETISKVVSNDPLTQEGYRLVINFGEPAGQTVPHIHVHILAGRSLQWPPG